MSQHKRTWLRVTVLCLLFFWVSMGIAGLVVARSMPQGGAAPGAGVIIIAALVVAIGLTAALQPVLIVVTAVASGSGVGHASAIRRCPVCRGKISKDVQDDRCPICGCLVTRDAA